MGNTGSPEWESDGRRGAVESEGCQGGGRGEPSVSYLVSKVKEQEVLAKK